MESQQMALSGNDDFIASIIINSLENPSSNESLMSDDDFAQELQLQEVIISSLINLQFPQKNPKSTMEIGESSKMGESSNPHTLCEICAERKRREDMFPLHSCAHAFCKDCISRHVSIKVEKRSIITSAAEAAAMIACPGDGCRGALDVAACREVVPMEVVSKWDEALCESAIPAAERAYCPYKNCSAFLVNDGGAVAIAEAECPFCRRLFCANCNVPWHSGIGCVEFSKLGKDEREREDLLLHDLAKREKWKRCSNCNFFVERNEGCLHMTCRCGYQFCYACGEVWTSSHGGCQ